MELFVKFQDAEGIPILLTKKEMESINRRLEFSHTIKVFGKQASRPLYLMPKEYDRGKRRFATYGDDEKRLLDVKRAAQWDDKINRLRKKSDTILISLLAIAAVGVWYLGGGKTPAVAYAVLTPGTSGAGLVLPIVGGIALVAGAIIGIRRYNGRKKGEIKVATLDQA